MVSVAVAAAAGEVGEGLFVFLVFVLLVPPVLDWVVALLRKVKFKWLAVYRPSSQRPATCVVCSSIALYFSFVVCWLLVLGFVGFVRLRQRKRRCEDKEARIARCEFGLRKSEETV